MFEQTFKNIHDVLLAGRGLQPRPKRFDFGRSKPKCLGQTETLGTG